MKIGILKETKTPPDKRVPFTPQQCKKIEALGIDVVVQKSDIRSFSDQEYTTLGLNLSEDLSDCDFLFGVKEVKIPKLIDNKKYFFFSHTIKEQPYNKELMKSLIQKGIQMIDYECLQDKKGKRLLGFGRYAGIVGSYNALLAWGKRKKTFELKPAHLCKDMEEVLGELKKLKLTDVKILVTGGGRVANGAIELLTLAGINRINVQEYVSHTVSGACFCVVDCHDYYHKKDQVEFDYPDFYSNSETYEVSFLPFLKLADIFISCHYWDNKSLPLFTQEDCLSEDFRTQVIADITCDIMGSVPTTLRSSTIDDPLYGYDRFTKQECDPFSKNSVTIMAVDNLPCELPRDASEDFGNALIEKVIPELLNEDSNGIIDNATICKNHKLNHNYEYLKDFAFN